MRRKGSLTWLGVVTVGCFVVEATLAFNVGAAGRLNLDTLPLTGAYTTNSLHSR